MSGRECIRGSRSTAKLDAGYEGSYVCHGHASRAGESGDATVAWVPGLDGDPGVHFSIIVHELAFVVNYDAGVPGRRFE